MSNIIDTLITKFQLDDADYARGAKHVIELTHKAGEAMDEAAKKAKEMARSIGEKFGFSELLAPLAALGTAAGLVELGKDALETAGKFDVLERKLAGVTGSFERAKQIMDFSEGEAGAYGIFGVEQLDKAATELEAFGLRAEQYLPVVEKLGAIFGQSGEGLDTFAEALGRIAEGDAGRAMMILERSGISRQALQAKGIQFTGERQVSSPAPQVIKAIEEVVSEKYGGVLGDLLNSPEAKMARLSVAWERAMRTMGTAIQTAVLPIVEAVSKTLNKIVESGQLDEIVSGFSKLFSLDGKNLSTALQKLADVAEELPAKIRSFEAQVKKTYEWLEPKLETAGKLFAALWVTDKVILFGEVVVGAYTAITAAIAAAAAAQITLDVATVAGAAVAALAVAAGVAAYATLTNATQGLKGAFKDLVTPTEKHKGPHKHRLYTWGDDSTGDGSNPVQDAQTRYLAQIAEHTKATSIDLRKYALGGGDLGRIGVTPTEMQGHLGANHGLSVNRVAGGSKAMLYEAIDAVVTEVLSRHVGNLMRQGIVPSR